MRWVLVVMAAALSLAAQTAIPGDLQQARQAVEEGDGAAALGRLEKLDAEVLARPAVKLLRARALGLAGRRSEAAALLESIQNRAAKRVLALAWAECGEFARAEGLFSRAPENAARMEAVLERVPAPERRMDYFRLRAAVFNALGNVKEAAESFNQALAMEPGRADLYRAACLFLLEHGLDRPAARLLEAAPEAGEEDRELQLVRAVVLARASRFEQAQQVLGAAIRRWPEWKRLYLVRGVVELGQFREEEARRSIEIAMKLGENGAEANYFLGLALLAKAPEQALKAARTAGELDPGDPWARILAGRALKQAGRHEAAVEELKEAVRMAPELAQAHYWLGASYLAMGKDAEGQREMERIEALRAQHPERVDSEDGGRAGKLLALCR